MATKIVTKNSSTASSVPTAAQLVQGELAVNVADKRLYTEDNAGAIVELGTKPSTIDINAGTIDGTAIGASTASTGAFTTLTATGLTVNNTTAFSYLPVSTAGSVVGTIGTGSGTIFNTPSVNASFGSGLAIDGSYSSDVSTINLKAFGPKFSSYSSQLAFHTSSGTSLTERMRIDSSGNVLVGTTVSGVGVGNTSTGHNINANGALLASRTTTGDTSVAYFNRNSSDGKIAEFYKDGTTVGSIGSVIGQYLRIGSGDVGVMFQDGSNAIEPRTTADANRDAAISLGASTNRFKDLYLSGGLRGDTLTLGNLAGTERMRIDASGNVGIGTSAPSEKLHVVGTAIVQSNDSFFGNYSGGAYIDIGNLATSEMWLDTRSSSLTDVPLNFRTKGSGAIKFTVGTSERMRIDSSGKVGIGCTPAETLDVKSGNASTYLRLQTSTDTGVYVGNANGQMLMLTDATERMRIDSSGNVGIGTSSPAKPLEVSDTTTDGTGGVKITSYLPTLEMDDISGGGTSFILQHDGTSTLFKHGATERMRIDSSGNMLVGTTTTDRAASAGITLNGAGFIDISRSGTIAGRFTRLGSDGSVIDFRRQGTYVGSISVSASATAYNTSSDQRLKENIADADDAGSKIDSIQVRKYDWKADGSHQDYGMIAQELQTVAPEAVSGDADSEEMMGVDYSKLVPMLIKEIQSLRNRVAQLETGE